MTVKHDLAQKLPIAVASLFSLDTTLAPGGSAPWAPAPISVLERG